MIYRAAAVLALAALLAACGGTPAATSGPISPTQPPADATQPPADATQAPGGGNSGNFESIARALFPPGATQQSAASIGNAFQLVGISDMSFDELKAFYSQQIPASGATETGRFEVEGTLTIALANPDGGILIVPANDQGQYLVTISVGTST